MIDSETHSVLCDGLLPSQGFPKLHADVWGSQIGGGGGGDNLLLCHMTNCLCCIQRQQDG